jgi:uncharacterized membrane protein SpoIIM required for sporulation
MQEVRFRRRRDANWRRLAQLVDASRRGRIADGEIPELMHLYRQAAADLAWARENGSQDLADMLNALVLSAHEEVHHAPEGTWKRIWRFYRHGLPREIRGAWKFIAIAFGLIVLGFAVGYWAVGYGGHAWSTAVLPPNLHANFRGKGIALALRPLIASYIYTHNVYVTLLAFGTGILYGIPTLFMMFENGLMVGGLAALFAQHRDTFVFWSLIVPHGVIEIFAVSLGGGAGLRLGLALLRPGDLSRRDALAAAGRGAVRLLLGIVPLLLVAALIEGLVTPSGLPPALKLVIGGVDLFLLTGYVLLDVRREVVR